MPSAMPRYSLVVVSIANVSTEVLYKRTASVPLHKQNFLLYSFGVAFNGLAFLAFSARETGMLQNYTAWTVLVICAQGLSGYLVGTLFKHIVPSTHKTRFIESSGYGGNPA